MKIMKKLTDLLEQLDYQCLQGTTDKEISSVVFDSRKAGPDSLFFCIKGAVSDGHTYAKEVAEKELPFWWYRNQWKYQSMSQ